MEHGLLLVDKTAGCTSHDVVMSARRLLSQKKIGHCGTLDPDATGLLLLTAGRATRLTRFLIRAPKVYEGVARLGMTTDTYDLSGEVVREAAARHLTEADVDSAMEGFEGNYLQTPPPYCAKKVGGVRYYELARRGEKVPDTKKEVTVFEFRRLAKLAPPSGSEGDDGACVDVRFRLSCSSGTYARSIVNELGEKLACGGTLALLRRTRIGAFKVEDARSIEALGAVGRGEAEAPPAEAPPAQAPPTEVSPADFGSAWIPFDEIQLPFDEIIADHQQERRIMNGQTVLIRDLASREGDWLKVTNERRRFIAVGAVVETIGAGGVGVIQPKVVFH